MKKTTDVRKKINLKLVHLIKYILWYIVFSMMITYILIEAGDIKIRENDSMVFYMILNDAVRPFILLLVTIVTGYFINFATSEKITHKTVIAKSLFSFNYRFQLWILDFVFLSIMICYIVVDRLSSVEVISSKDKLYSILMLLCLAYFFKFVGWFIYKILKEELLLLWNIVILALSLPAIMFQQMNEEIYKSELSLKYKKIFSKLFRIICITALGYIIYALIIIFVQMSKHYF